MPRHGYARVTTGVALPQEVERELQPGAAVAAGAAPPLSSDDRVVGGLERGELETGGPGRPCYPGVAVPGHAGRRPASLKDLQDIARELERKGVALKCTEQPVDNGTGATRGPRHSPGPGRPSAQPGGSSQASERRRAAAPSRSNQRPWAKTTRSGFQATSRAAARAASARRIPITRRR